MTPLALVAIVLGACLVLAVAAALYVALVRVDRPEPFRRALWAGLIAHVAGLAAMYAMFSPRSDHVLYLRLGRFVAEAFAQGDWAIFASPALWHKAPPVLGTHAFVYGVAFLGPALGWHLLPLAAVLAALGFLGIVALTDAARRALPPGVALAFAWALALTPSVALWPSWLGKEAPMFAALGGVFWALAAVRDRPARSLAVLVGSGAVLAMLRPQVGAIAFAVAAPALVVALPARARLPALGALVLVGAGLVWGLDRLGLGALSDVGRYLDDVRTFNLVRGSRSGIPHADANGSPLQALANVLLRPFPWEVRSARAAVTSLELYSFWTLVLVRLRPTARRLWALRRTAWPMALLAFGLLYALGLGLAAVNQGLIARQRTHAWPALLVILAAGWARTPSERAAPHAPTPTPPG